MALTDTAIRTVKPRDKLYRLSDALGLCLEVTTAGGKLWRLRYRFAGKAKMMGLGAYPAVTLARAREARDAARRVLAEGQDPSRVKQAEKQARAAQVHTFEQLAEEWYAYSTPQWAESTSRKARLYLDNDILPDLGRRPVAEVTRPDLVALMRRVEKHGTLNAAGKIRQWLGQIFRYGLVNGTATINPATDLDVVAAHAPRARHHPHVPLAELPALLHALEASRSDLHTLHAIRLLLLTAARPGELRQAPWAEFDLHQDKLPDPAGSGNQRNRPSAGFFVLAIVARRHPEHSGAALLTPVPGSRPPRQDGSPATPRRPQDRCRLPSARYQPG